MSGALEFSIQKGLFIVKKAKYILFSIFPAGAMVWIQAVCSILFSLAIGMGCSIGLMWLEEQDMDLYYDMVQQLTNDYIIYVLIAAQLFTAVIMLIWFWVRCNRSVMTSWKRLQNKKAWLCMLAFCFGAYCITVFYLEGLNLLFPAKMQEYEEAMELLMPEVGGFLTFLCTVIMAPVSEELVFRGITLYYTKKISSRFWVANIVQAALFGLVHMNIIQGIYAFGLGLILGYLCHCFESLWLAMAAHAVFNFMGTGAGGLMEWVPDSIVTYVVALALGIILLFYGIYSSGSSRRAL